MASLLDLYRATSPSEFIDWLVKEYGLLDGAQSTNRHKLRRDEMGERVRLYRDDAALDIARVIDVIWRRPDYREQLKHYLGLSDNGATGQPTALQQNISVRIVHEVASLYDKPAVRKLTADQTRFKLEEKRLRLHEITQDYHRLLWLCNEVLVWQFEGVEKKTKLKVITPDLFDVLPHPDDVTAMAGVLMPVPMVTMLPADQRMKLPCWELWDDTYRYLINASGKLCDADGTVPGTPIKHELARIPGVLLHRREPSERALDPRPGRDIASAHRTVVLYNIMLMRLSKTQGERQPMLQGNLANVAKGQTADGENPLVLPPEVVASMLDTVTDPDHYLKAKKEAVGGVGQTYGVSYEQMGFEEQGATVGSAKAFQVRREKLSELRGEQRRRALVNEAEVVELIGFDSTDMKVDHKEQALPQDPTEAMALLDLRTRLGMDSPVKALMREDPDLTVEEAKALIKENVEEWAAVIEIVRALNIPIGATADNPGNDPQINGSNKIVEKVDVAGLSGTGIKPPSSGSGGAPPAPPPAP